MSQTSELQSIARCLLAAGYDRGQEGKEQYLLSVDPEESFLQGQQWSGNLSTQQVLIADSVRPSSTAACLITPARKLVICISPSSALSAYIYDQEEREWVKSDKQDIGALPSYIVHRDGKLASSVDVNGRAHVVFQALSGRLTYLDNSWSSTILPVTPVAGTPLSISFIGNVLHILYISAKDNFIHDVTVGGQNWKDRIVVQRAFNTKPKNLMMTENEDKDQELYVMTGDNALLKTNKKGRLMRLGTVKMGKFVSERIVDLCAEDAWNGTLTEDTLKTYLAKHSSCIDIPGSEHSVTPLAAACIRGQLDVVRLLLRYHANPNALSPQKRTPLFYATSTLEGRDRCAIVRALLQAGARVDDCYAENGFNTPLMNAVTLISDRDVVDELLNHGASPTAKDVAGHTVVMLAKGTPLEGVVSAERFEQANLSKTERHIIGFLVALLTFIVAYTNSQRVRRLVEQIVFRLKDINDANDGLGRIYESPAPSNNPTAVLTSLFDD